MNSKKIPFMNYTTWSLQGVLSSTKKNNFSETIFIFDSYLQIIPS